ncbi:MAG TPA: hypothetical protein VF159_04435 [Gemmatimonadaceae bacterium]
MRTSRVVGSALSTLLLTVTACATPGAVAPVQPTGAIAPVSAPVDASTLRDSAAAQEVADARGPAVAISASFETFSGMRRVQSWFHTDQDAYVVIGHLGEDGVVRIVFPQPGDDGFVKGGHTYYLPRIFAGFIDSYRSRFASNVRYSGLTPARNESYDGGMGYLFAIASWRPLHTEEMQDAGGWATWELSDDEYFRDPRPAIYELASLFAGGNREAYTVKFARYFGTASYAMLASFNLGYNAFWPYGSSFASGWCSGYEPLGYFFGMPYFPWARSALLYSGFGYAYDAARSCYRSTFGTPIYRIAAQPFVPTTPTANPFWTAPTHPGVRRPPDPGNEALQSRIAAPSKSAGDITTQYRQRGLFMADNEATGSEQRRGGKRALDSDAMVRAGWPSIQEMVNRGADDRQPATPRARGRSFGDNGFIGDRPGHGVNRPTSVPQESMDARRGNGRTQPMSTPRSWGRSGSAESPRSQPRPSSPSVTPDPGAGSASTRSAPAGAAHTSGSTGSEPMSSPRGSKPPQR